MPAHNLLASGDEFPDSDETICPASRSGTGRRGTPVNLPEGINNLKHTPNRADAFQSGPNLKTQRKGRNDPRAEKARLQLESLRAGMDAVTREFDRTAGYGQSAQWVAYFGEYYGGRFRAILSRMNIHPQEFEDLGQDFMIKAIDVHLREGGEYFRLCFHSIVSNFARDYRRSTGRGRARLVKSVGAGKITPVQFDGGGEKPPRPDIKDTLVEEIEDALGRIDPPAAELLRLRYFDGFKPSELERVYKVNAKVISARVQRALKKLHTFLDYPDFAKKKYQPEQRFVGRGRKAASQ